MKARFPSKMPTSLSNERAHRLRVDVGALRNTEAAYAIHATLMTAMRIWELKGSPPTSWMAEDASIRLAFAPPLASQATASRRGEERRFIHGLQAIGMRLQTAALTITATEAAVRADSQTGVAQLLKRASRSGRTSRRGHRSRSAASKRARSGSRSGPAAVAGRGMLRLGVRRCVGEAKKSSAAKVT